MGSGSSRRPDDISKPGPIKKSGNGQGASGNVGKTNELNCPTSKRILFLKSDQIKIGQKLHLQALQDSVSINSGIAQIKIIAGKTAKLLSLCIQTGHAYKGVVEATKEGELYADFKWTS